MEIPHRGMPRLKFTVPSTGSIIQRKSGSEPSTTPISSVRMEWLGNAFRIPSTMSFSLPTSAMVTTSFADLYFTSPSSPCRRRQSSPASRPRRSAKSRYFFRSSISAPNIEKAPRGLPARLNSKMNVIYLLEQGDVIRSDSALRLVKSRCLAILHNVNLF